MASLIPKSVKKEITDAWLTETWKLVLLSSAHTPTAAQKFLADVVANEITDPNNVYVKGIGDSPGGVAVSSKASIADGNNYALDAADVVIGPGATLNYRYGILYQNTGSAATSKIRAQIDFATDQIVTNGTSIIQWNALGIIYIS